MQGNWGKTDKEPWYEHVPKLIETGYEGNVLIMWNQQVKTDKIIPNNKLDNIVHDNGKETCLVIDVATLHNLTI
jgi:hypothetical protein